MGHRTIPAPSNAEFGGALMALRGAAQHHGVNANEAATHEFILQVAEFQAQQAAEIRWLHNLMQAGVQA